MSGNIDAVVKNLGDGKAINEDIELKGDNLKSEDNSVSTPTCHRNNKSSDPISLFYKYKHNFDKEMKTFDCGKYPQSGSDPEMIDKVIEGKRKAFL